MKTFLWCLAGVVILAFAGAVILAALHLLIYGSAVALILWLIYMCIPKNKEPKEEPPE